MNTRREEDHGEYWPDEGTVFRFDVKRFWKWLMSLFVLCLVVVTTTQAQVAYCGVDVAKDFVPYGGVAKQTLSNMCTYSEQADNAAWTKANATVTANSVTAPDGALTADTVTASVGASTHVAYPAAITVVNATSYRMSIYAKAGTHSYIKLRSQAPATAGIGINLSTGAVGFVDVGVTSHRVDSVGNGWYRIVFTYTTTAVSDNITPYVVDAAYANSWTAVGTETVYVWGASLQLASEPADYLATTSAAATLGPLCPIGYTQSLTDPSRCFIVGPVAQRTIRTW